MLSAVFEVVRQEGWFDTSQPYEKAIYLSQGASLWLVLTRRGQPDTFVKFSDLVSLAHEAERGALASARYPQHAARFLGHSRRGTLEVLATEAVDFRPLTPEMLVGAADATHVREGVLTYFNHMRERGPLTGGPSVADSLATLQAYYADHALAAQARPALALLAEVAHALPAWPQHGDFVLNNLGLRPDGRLVVFDWEDFGAIVLPGMDLFTLEWSLAQEDAPAPLDCAACCAAMGLDIGQYQRLALAYALAFRWLKRNYGPGIQGRLDELIAALSAGHAASHRSARMNLP